MAFTGDCSVRQVASKFLAPNDVPDTTTVQVVGEGCTAGCFVQIDRNSDGDYLDVGEDVTLDVFREIGVSGFRGLDAPRAIAPPRVGEAGFTLGNRDGDYAPGSTVEAGRPVRISVDWDAAGADLFNGNLDMPVQHPETGFQRVDIRAHSAFNKLKGLRVSTALYASITIDVAIGHVLDAASWPAGARTLDTGKTTLDWWWADDEDAFDALVTLINTEGPGGSFYEDGDGNLIFHNRHRLITQIKSMAIQTTVRGLGASPNLGAGFRLDDGLQNVINSAVLEAKTRSADATAVVWSLGETALFGPTQVLTFAARSTTGNPFQAAVTPVENTDFTVSAGAIATVTLDRTSGGSVTITMTAGAAGATVTGLQLRADLVSLDGITEITNRVNASTSITKHGTRGIPSRMKFRAEIGSGAAQDLVDGLVTWYQDGRPTAMIPLDSVDATTIAAQLARTFGDRIRVIVDAGNINIDTEYWIFGIRFHWRRAGMFETVWEVEEADLSNYATWGAGKWGTMVWGF